MAIGMAQHRDVAIGDGQHLGPGIMEPRVARIEQSRQPPADDPAADDPDRHDRRWSGSSSGRHPPCCGGVPPLPLTRIAAAAAPAMISTAKILRSSRIGRLYPVPADATP